MRDVEYIMILSQYVSGKPGGGGGEFLESKTRVWGSKKNCGKITGVKKLLKKI